MKRIIQFIIILLCTQIQAQIYLPDFSVNGYYYRIISVNEVELVPNPNGCIYYSGNVVIPESVDYNGINYKVTSLGNYAFNSANFSSLVLPKGIHTIGEYCFYYATFRGTLDLPDSLKTINQYAFSEAKVIEAIRIPSKVETIGLRAFSPIKTLKNIIVDTANQYYCSYNGVLYSKDTTTLFCCPGGITGDFTIPNGVKEISALSFGNCVITSIVIPNTVVAIKNAAFSQCTKITSINIPSSVKYIEGGIFKNCQRLTNITIDSSNINYKVIDNAIYSINMDTILSHHLASDTVIVPLTVRVLGMESFSETKKLKFVVLPRNIINIQYGAFSSSGIRSINLPESLQSIGEAAFKECENLGSIKIPNSVSYLGNSVFSNCSSLSSVVMSNSVTIIPSRAFEYCSSLNSFVWGNSIERINSLAFLYCSKLPKKIIFPESLKVLEGWALERTGTIEVEFMGIIDTIGKSNFANLEKLKLRNLTPPFTYEVAVSDNILEMTIPCETTPNYLSNPNWSSYNYTEDCDGIEDIDPQSAVQVLTQHKAVDVYNAENYSVAIYDLTGRCHTAEPATGYNLRHYTLPNSGVYIVRVNGKGYKVVVQ